MKPYTHEEYEKLCKEIWHHDILYYVDHAPVISDEEYDLLYKKLEEIEKEHPEWIKPSSPTQRVSEALSKGFKSVVHRIPMLSLANTYSKDELADFIKRMHKLTEKKELTFSCELKMDGLAITVVYEKGIYVRGLTRGDGKKGDDVTTNIKTIANLPQHLHGSHIPDICEVRGEVYMTHAAFERLNKQRIKENEEPWVNPRNAAAGSLKLLDSQEVAKRELSIVFYQIADESNHSLKSQYDTHALMKQWGLPILPHIARCHTLDEIWDFAETIREQRRKLPFDIDGIVVKLDDLHAQKKLGTTGKHPRWAVAYKFAAEQATTRILDITVQVGRTGVLTPVAELEPIFLAGSTIARATLHNEDEIQRKDIRVGDIACIEKGGDVIPKVVSVDPSLRPHHSKPWKMPIQCPSCGADVSRIPGEVAVRCPNSDHCPEQQMRRIIYFASKDAMDIEHMGEKVVEQLFNLGFVKRPSDIYKLTAEELYQLPNFKDKAVNNLLMSINVSRNVTLDRFIMALGIKHVGASMAETLAQKTGNIETLETLSQEDLKRIEGVGDKVAGAIVDYFSSVHNREEIRRLLSLGVKPKPVAVVSYEGHAFSGKTFVLTGALKNYTRNAAASLIKERGGKVTDSVSKKTDYLLCGEEAGSKLEKAKSLSISILSEEDFIAML